MVFMSVFEGFLMKSTCRRRSELATAAGLLLRSVRVVSADTAAAQAFDVTRALARIGRK